MKRCSIVLVALGLTNVVSACCMSYADRKVTLTEETAAIIWDAESKVQHFVRRASFAGEAKDFGFILPVPSKPEAIEVADEELFTLLARLEPLRSKGRYHDVAAKSDEAAAVEVLEQKLVGDFQASVIRSDSGLAISGWLNKNGHKMRPAMTPWFDHYNKKKWMYVAFRYMGSQFTLKTKAVRVTTKTDQPYYPYKMPTDTWEAGHFRPMDLFFVSNAPVTANYSGGKAWEAARKWSVSIQPRQSYAIGTYLNLGDVRLPENLTVTHFSNSPAATNYEEDIFFSPLPDRKEGVAIAGGGGFIASMMAVAVAVRRRKRARQELVTPSSDNHV